MVLLPLIAGLTVTFSVISVVVPSGFVSVSLSVYPFKSAWAGFTSMVQVIFPDFES
jgi:hypothetical protein